MKMFIIATAFVTLAIGCHSQTVHPTVVRPTDTPSCAAACKRLQELHCDEGKDLDDGTTCEAFCIETQDSGHALRPSCIIDRVRKCADIQPLCFEE